MINLLFPKFFSILELFVRRIRVNKEASVYKIPTKSSFIILVKNTELIYADIEICKAKINDKAYILFILEILFIFLNT